jgi:hypothetical protein
MIRTSQLLIALLFPLSLFAAGHEVSAVRYAPNDSFAGVPSLASSGNRFLALWPISSQIFGAVSDPASDVVPQAFTAVPFANTSTLRLTNAGSGYVAIWSQTFLPPAIATFTSDGVLQRRGQLDVAALSNPRLASNGTRLLVVDQLPGFPSTPATTDLSVYDLTGELVRRFPLPVTVGDNYAVTSIGNDFVVVTAGRSGIIEWRIASDGTILSTLQIQPQPANPALSVYSIGVASKNGSIAVAWSQLQVGTVGSAVIDANGNVVKLPLPNGDVPPAGGMAVLPVDSGFVVVWNVQPSPPDLPAIFALRLGDDGVLLDTRPADIGRGSFGAAASSGKTIEMTTFTPPSTSSTIIATVDENVISSRTATPTAVTPVRQLLPVVAGNGSGFTAAWMEQEAGLRSIAAGRVSNDAQPLDGSGILLDQTFPSSPAIARGFSQTLIVWGNNDGVVASRLTQSGQVLDTAPISIARQAHARSITAVWNGSRYFIVWTDGIQLFGAFVGLDGAATPSKLLGVQREPLTDTWDLDMAWDGRQFIVVYGEVSYAGVVCGECALFPDHVRVLRVSAAGDAIDVMPVRIPGVHLRAHVASSGSESLIALDSETDTSAMIVTEEFGFLKLGPEVPVFHWFSNFGRIGSDVVWNGSTYVMGSRYVPTTHDSGWLGASQISQSGVLLRSSFARSDGPPDLSAGPPVPSIAANDAQDTAFVISEIAPPWYVARARLYLMSEMAPMPAPPPAPRNVVSDFGGGTTRIEWQSDGADGFVLEQSLDFGKSWIPVVVTGDVRSATIHFGFPGNQFRVSAFGPGGLSAGTITSIGSPQRRHATSR